MSKRITIRKLLAFALLAIFTLGTTPVIFLHRLVANHSDVLTTTTDNGSPQLHTSGIDCHCNSQVVTNPYTYDTNIVSREIPSLFANYASNKRQGISSAHLSYPRFRGPPFMA